MNFQITQGTGTLIATDIGGGSENYQKIKLIDATPGSTSGTGISSNPFWVTGTILSNIGTTGGLALDTSINGILLGQNSTTSGQFGPLIQGAATTSLPSYATSTTNPLSLTLTGLLRVDGSNVTQPVSGTVTAVQPSGANLHVNIDNFPVASLSTNLVSVSGSPITLGQTIMSGSFPVTFASDQSALPPSKDIAVTGTLGSLVDTVVINCNALSTVGWTTSGTWSGTMIMEVQYGDGQWFLTEVIDTNVDGSGKPFIITSWTESLNNDPWITNVGGATQARIRFTVYNSGTATIVFNGSIGINAIRSYNLNASSFLTKSWLQDGTGNAITSTSGSLNTNITNASIPVTQSGTWTVFLENESIEIGTVDQGTPNTLANAWPVELSDGTNLLGTSSHPIRVDPTGTTTQPVNVTNATLAVTQSGVWTTGRTWTLASGTDSISAVQSGAWNISNITGTISLPTGAATETTLAAIKIDTDKFTFASTRLLVDGSGVTQPISGTVTATQGTSPWVVSLASTTITGTVAVTQSTSPWVISGTVTSNIGTTNGLALDATVSALQVSQGSTTSGQKGTLELGAVTTAAPAYTNGQSSALSLDTAGNLRVVLAAGTIDIGKVDQGNQGTIAQSWFTEITDGTNVLGVAAHPIRVDPTGTTTQPISGTVTANAGTGTFAENLTQVNGSTISLGQTTAAASLPVVIASNQTAVPVSLASTTITGTVAVTQSTSPWVVSGTVTSNIGTTGGLALDATLAKLTLAQGSTTSGETGPLIQGAVTTAAPTYTTAQTSPLSLTTSGALRIDGSAVTQPISGSVTVVQPTGTNLHTVVDSGSITVANASIPVTQSGTWTVQPGNTPNTTPWLTTIQQGGNAAAVTASNALKVDGSGVTQPISAVSLPLPTGASTSANQTNGSMKTQIVDASGNVVTTTAVSTQRPIDVNPVQSPEGYASQQNQVFAASFDFNLPNAGTETPALFIKNPIASGKTLVIKRILVSGVATGNNEAVAIVYSDPTTSANGTAQTATTTSIGSGATAVATVFSGPTVTGGANGARFVNFQVPAAGNNTPTGSPLSVDGIIRIAPNHTLLITGKPAANSMLVGWSIFWQEI